MFGKQPNIKFILIEDGNNVQYVETINRFIIFSCR